MTKAPTIRVSALIGIGLVVLYGLGRWDAIVSARMNELRDDTRTILDLGKVARRRSDSLRQLERTVLAQAASLQRLEDSLETRLENLLDLDAIEVVEIRNLPVEALLPPLRLRPITVGVQRLYATDSSGVRVLAGRMLRLDQLERRFPVLEDLAESRGRRASLFQAATSAAQTRADSAESRVVDLEKLLVRWQASSTCRLLLIFPCPSRGLAFVGGVAVTLTAALVVMK